MVNESMRISKSLYVGILQSGGNFDTGENDFSVKIVNWNLVSHRLRISTYVTSKNFQGVCQTYFSRLEENTFFHKKRVLNYGRLTVVSISLRLYRITF